MNEEFLDDIERQKETLKEAEMQKLLDEALQDPFNKNFHPRPWTARVVKYDGTRYQLYDALGKPCLGSEMLVDADDVAVILHNVNQSRTENEEDKN